MKLIKNKWFIFFIFLLIAISYLVFMNIRWFSIYNVFIFSDGSGYYRYLPELIIDGKFGEYNKYPIGTALLQLPFFLIAHIAASVKDPAAADGYSMLYQYALACSAIFYFSVGMVFLYKLLTRLYHNITSLLVCAFITAGTMLPVYSATGFASFSHVYAFAACTLFCLLAVKKETDGENRKRRHDVLLGVSLGLVFLVRNTDIIIVMFYVLLGMGNKGYIKRLKALLEPFRLMRNAVGFFIPASLQFIVWKLQTGSFIINAYSNESFEFLTRPKIYEVLFSDAKGLFIFCPVLIVSVLGFLFERKEEEIKSRIACIFIILAQTYIYASWWCWWLGGAYGARAFCDILCIFAIGMGAFWEHFLYCSKPFGKPQIIKTLASLIICVCFCMNNCVYINSAHYTSDKGIIDNNLSNWYELYSAYHELFG